MHPFESLAHHDPALAPLLPDLRRAAELLIACFRGGGKLLICGNGGSAADSEHIAGELAKGYLLRRPLPAELTARLAALDPVDGERTAGRLQGGLPAIALTSNAALITAIANDQDGELIFAQQALALGRPGDALLAISTSGCSRSVLRAVQVGRALGLVTIGLGGPAGRLAELADLALRVPGSSTAEIQQRHQLVYHALCEVIEHAFFE